MPPFQVSKIQNAMACALLALIVHANPDYCKCTQLHAMRVSSACVDMIRFVKENANNKVMLAAQFQQFQIVTLANLHAQKNQLHLT